MKLKSFRSRVLEAAVLALAGLVVLPCVAGAQQYTIGSGNTVTADPPVPVPNNVKPCVVQLFSGVQFEDYSVHDYSYTPPSNCKGPYEKIVFSADFSVTEGIQYDRTAVVDLGYANIYFGTTAEPGPTLSPSWHIERDETDYAALFAEAQTGHIILGNTVNSDYNGIISGSAELKFYPAKNGWNSTDTSRPADQVLPLEQPNGSGGINEPAYLNTGTDQLATTFTLPKNVERAYLDVITQSQINDEFWYSCVPNDVATELQSCNGTSFREAEISIDGQPAGVAPVYPWIFTGGFDPYLWFPIPGVQTLNFKPYRVDLTPFAGVLSNGEQHTVAVSVFNANGYFSATATLLLYLDDGSKEVTGAVTTNTLASAPSPAIAENLQTDSSGDVTGSVSTTSARNFKISGYVKTSHGRVDTDVEQSVNFSNVQDFTINANQYVQDITQTTTVKSLTTARQGFAVSSAVETFGYPLTFNIVVNFNADGSATEAFTSGQQYLTNVLAPFYAGTVQNKVNSADTLNFDASGNFTGNTNTKSSQSYNSFDTAGGFYTCSLASASNALTSVSKGCPGESSK
jgi:Peptide N-acetyl-beta-D-glucosaminyl asparaginase amidase A